jgi:hypothetical protein
MSSEQLEQITTDELMKEIQRRIDCAKKPEKRIILIGMRYSSSFHSFILLVCAFAADWRCDFIFPNINNNIIIIVFG